MKPIYILVAFFGICAGSIFLSGNLYGEIDAKEIPTKKKLVILTGDDLTHACGTHEFEAG